MPPPRVVLTRRWPEPCERLAAERFDARPGDDDRPMDRDRLVAALREADALFCTVTDRLDAETLSTHGRRARLLANFGVGVNHIDLEACRRLGITVTNTPGVLTDSTADLAMTLLLMVARRAGEGERELRAGRWQGWRPTHLLGTAVTGKTLGIVGFGRIGRAVASRAHHGFRMRVLVTSRTRPAMHDLDLCGASWRNSLDELVSEADFLSLHCPLTEHTRHLLDARRLARMKTGSFLVNTGRGELLDEAALADALDTGPLAGAGLDVYENEPRVTPSLLKRENVVLLPHLGSATRESREAMGMKVIENATAFFDGRDPPDRVA